MATSSPGTAAPPAAHAVSQPQTEVHILGTPISSLKQYRSYVTNIRALKHGLNQTFRIIVFLGEFDKNPFKWHTEYNVVGRVTMLGRSPNTKCDRCRDDLQSGLIASGTVPLTSAILQDIHAKKLRSLEPEDVVPYLAKNLHWRVTLFDGHEKSVTEVPGLKVSVASVGVTVGEDGIPTYEKDYETHVEATTGKPAGLNSEDEA